MDSALASVLGLVFTAIALYGFYWVIRLAVRDGMLEADRRRSRAAAAQAMKPDQPAEPARPTPPPTPATPTPPTPPAQPA